MLHGKRVAILGTGTMGSAISGRLIASGAVESEQFRGTIGHASKTAAIALAVGFPIGTDNAEACRGADVILVCTKPRGVAEALGQARDAGALSHGPLVISVAAGVATPEIQGAAGAQPRVIRAMPNTPSLIGEGMTVLSPGASAGDEDLAIARTIFESLGRVQILDEEHMDAVTGLSGSGPAFVYVIIEALAEGGVMTGLPRAVATELAAQTVKGAARMVLETGRHPAALKDDVTTPAGCTVSALLALEDGRLRSVLARGVQEAARSAAGLGAPKKSRNG